MASSGFHSSILTMTQTAILAPPGNLRRVRFEIGEKSMRSVGSIRCFDGPLWAGLFGPVVMTTPIGRNDKVSRPWSAR